MAVAFSWTSLLDHRDGLFNAALGAFDLASLDWLTDQPSLNALDGPCLVQAPVHVGERAERVMTPTAA